MTQPLQSLQSVVHNLYNRLVTSKKLLLNLNQEKQLVLAFIVILGIFSLISFAISSQKDIEQIIIEKEEYKLTYDNSTDIYTVEQNGEIKDPQSIVDRITEDIASTIGEKNLDRVIWELPGTIMREKNRIHNEFSSKEELEQQLQKDIERRNDFDTGGSQHSE